MGGAVGDRSIDRRLRAVLIADAVGSTERTRRAEEAAIVLLLDGIDRLGAAVSRHGGRVARTNGDGVLAVFGSAADALACALAFQSAWRREAAGAAPGLEPFAFRMGLHVGDVAEIGGEPYGDAVNVAARLEAMATPGAVCVSRAVHDLVVGRLPARFDALGPQRVKGIDGTIEAFLAHDPDAPPSPAVVTTASAGKAEEDGPPSVAVLPLTPLTTEDGAPLLARGLASDVTSRLTRFRRVDVIAHASAAALGAGAASPMEVARRLRARYVATGALAVADRRMRLTLELVDGATDRLLWGQTFDRPLEAVFETLGDAAETIAAAMMVEIDRAERRRAAARDPASLDAFGLCLRGTEEMLAMEPSGCAAALAMFERAAALDPGYARALASIARANGFRWIFRWAEDAAAAIAAAEEFAARAVDVDPNDPSGHAELGWVRLYAREHARSLAAYRMAIELNPGDADLTADYADALKHDGDPAASVPLFERAIRLNPHRADHYLRDMAHARYVMRDFDGAVATIDRMRRPHLSQRVLVASLAMLGREGDTRKEAEALRRRDPGFAADAWIGRVPDRLPEHSELLLEGLKRAGF